MKKMSWYIFFSFARTRIETIWYELCHSFCFWELEKEAEKTLAKMLYYTLQLPSSIPGILEKFEKIWDTSFEQSSPYHMSPEKDRLGPINLVE